MAHNFFYTWLRCFFGCIFFIFLVAANLGAQETRSAKTNRFLRQFADTTLATLQLNQGYYLFSGEINAAFPGRIIRQLDDEAAIITIKDKRSFDLLLLQGELVAANNAWKFAPGLESRLTNGQHALKRFVLTGSDPDELVTLLETLQQDVRIIRRNEAAHSIIVETSAGYLINNLLPLAAIIFIDVPAEAHSEANIIGYDRSFHGLSAVDYTIPGANGKNIVAGVKEQQVDATDLDLHKRVLPSTLAASATTNHATVIASIIGGAGNSFYDGRGIAYACKIFPSSFANLFADDPMILTAEKVSVQNHSYGTIVQQFYGAEAVSYDALTWGDKKMVSVFSSGNQGLAAPAEGAYANITGYANLTGNFKMAKNIITVGAIDRNGSVPAESSAGPLYDGRLAPQLIALGPNGTSDAAAIVSGTVAVLQQVYADSNGGELPAASLVKALLYNSADDIGLPGIDYKTGYGLLNSFSAIRALQQNVYREGRVTQSQEWVAPFTVPANAAQVKVTLCWTDTTAQVNNNKALINDLDLELAAPGPATVYQPWVLDATPAEAALAAPPTRGKDSLNTSEQVSIRLPVAGTYTVKVKGSKIASGSIPFSLAYQVDTLNSFLFLSPQHASDVLREEKPLTYIKWKTFVADTTTLGKLLISYDRGASWQILEQSLKISTNQYPWQLPDTVSSAVLKMETPFGSFLSKEFILAPVTRVGVDFVCTDSARISWPPHLYATGYKVFTLTDSPYLKEIAMIADTFFVFHRKEIPSRVFAVQPVLDNGIPAARSIALDIEQQGVNCFYRTLIYNLLDLNKLELKLAISAPAYTDSVYFEKVSPGGTLLQTYGSKKTSPFTNLYTHLVTEVPAGITYLRAKIKLGSGSFVYTDIIPVLTSGSKVLRFYPNPVSRQSQLNYVLQQGISPGNRLQFFDIAGRLLKTFESIPDQLDMSTFPAGIIIFKLVEQGGRVLATGKLVVL